MEVDDRDWERKPIKDWDEFNNVVSKFEHREWLFRGHHNADWPLETSLYRMLDDIEKWLELKRGKKYRLKKNVREELLLNKFRSSAHLYINHTLPHKSKQLEWNAIMQHYGTPSRLLDVTFSPYIAMYFALEKGNGNCRILAFNHRKMREHDEARFSDFDNMKDKMFSNVSGKTFILPYEPKMTTERLLAQQGAFLVPNTINKPFQKVLDNYKGIKGVYINFLIPAKLRFDGLNHLERMNITSTTLFPGLEGFCKSLRFSVIENINRLRPIS
jgi:hypothetical protein